MPVIPPWLLEWLKQPRVPVLESSDPTARWLITEALRGNTVEFQYWGGSTPGNRRHVSPAFVFRLGGRGPMYLSGYCHLRQAERVFHLDRIVPVADKHGFDLGGDGDLIAE